VGTRRKNETRKPGADGLAIVLDYLAIRNKIWSTIEIFHQTDIDDEIVGLAGVALASVDPATPESWPTAVVAAWTDGRDRIVTISQRKSTGGSGHVPTCRLRR